MNKYVEALEEVKTEGRKFKNQSAIEEALEKQIPMKPINRFEQYGINLGLCPRCHEGVNYEMQHCYDCGQRLDWSKEK